MCASQTRLFPRQWALCCKTARCGYSDDEIKNIDFNRPFQRKAEHPIGCSAFLWILRLFEKISGKIQAGKEMALHFWERHSKILPNRGRVEARVSANRPQCRRNGELSAGRKEISAVCASHPAAAYRNRRAVPARPPLCGVTAHRRRNFLCIPIPFPSAIGAQPPMS